uniref:Ubiquitin-like domain-containing protein n=1 Tax=Fundulus heteroclitus TaxID=8078 RepID=A0A3Q2QX97_FUNHE
MIYQVVVTGLDGQKITIDLCDNEKDMQRITVQELKTKIATKLPGNPGKRKAQHLFALMVVLP